jgi:hypothetical protein
MRAYEAAQQVNTAQVEQQQARQLRTDRTGAEQEKRRTVTSVLEATGAGVAQAAGELVVKKSIKTAWQAAQEALEELAFASFMLTGPLVLLAYVTRWFGGNMMNLRLTPAYEFSDPIDYERHIKAIIIGALSFIVWGLIIVVLYYVTNPGQAALQTFAILSKTLFAQLIAALGFH